MIPNFIIVGERRSGTTSLANLIEQHPDIFMLKKRDGGFFIDAAARTGAGDGPPTGLDPDSWDGDARWDWYQSQFDGATIERAVGEKSADYLFWHHAHARMVRYLPECRFIVTLRNPIDRAWSHYWNEVGKGRETLAFEAATNAGADRCARSLYSLNHLSYLERGLYHQSIARFLNVVSPDKVHIVILEQLLNEPDIVYDRVFGFLGVASPFRPAPGTAESNSNWTTVPRDWARDGWCRALASGWDAAAGTVAGLFPAGKFRRRRIHAVLNTPFHKRAATLRMKTTDRERLRDIYRDVIPGLRTLTPQAAETAANYWTELR